MNDASNTRREGSPVTTSDDTQSPTATTLYIQSRSRASVSLEGEGPAQSTSTVASTSPDHASPQTPFQLTAAQRILAGSGHVLNDLCASLWFTYLLLYMEKVVGFSDIFSAGLLLWGQVVDGVATPLVGYETDHVDSLWPCKKTYGRCKSWHLLGIVLVTISFPFVFSPCIGYSFYTTEWSEVDDWVKVIYYAPFIAIFQTGWACTQISHLALIPKLTPDELTRTEILAIRYAFTVASNVTVFIMTWLFLTDAGKQQQCDVGTQDSMSFSFIALIAVGIGLLFSVLFHVFVVEKSDQAVKRSVSILKIQESITDVAARREVENENEERKLKRNRTPTDLRARAGEGTQALLASDDEDERVHEQEVNRNRGIRHRNSVAGSGKVNSRVLQPAKIFSTTTLNSGKEHMGVKDWLKMPQFYNVAGLYMCTRLTVNLSQSYVPLYVENSLQLQCGYVAVIPLIMYCSGFCVSLFIKLLNKYLGRQLAYSIGSVLTVTAAGIILFLQDVQILQSWGIYLVAVLLGGGASAILVTSLSITADLIGNNIESGAFVYGAMSFCDKISCGLAVVLINSLYPCQKNTYCDMAKVKEFYRDALGFSSGGAALGGVIFIILLTLIIVRKHRHSPRT